MRTLTTFELDMRVSPRLGVELQKEINDSCAATQSPIMQEHPNMLIVNREQFRSLIPDLLEVEGSTDRIYRTAAGYVMDVRVVDMDGNHIKVMENPIDNQEIIL